MPYEMPQAADLYIAGREALKAGDSTTALKFVAAAVESSPSNAGWRATLGQLLLESGRLNDAIAELRQAVEDAPDVARFQVLLARALNQAHSYEEAGVAFRRATVLDGKSLPAWSALGRFSQEQQDWPAAKESFQTVVQLDPKNVAAHVALADLYAQEGDLPAEVTHRSIVADLRSDHVPSQVLYAASLMKSERYAEARERYARIAELRPDHPAASAVASELDRWAAAGGAPEGGVVSVAYYDDVYARANHYQDDGAALEHAAHFSLICEMLQSDGAESVLDLGCGPGQFAQYLRSRTPIAYLGVDYSPVAIASAKSRGVSNADFEVLDIVESAIPSCPSSTSIVCTEVLEHVLDDESLIAKIPEGHPCYFSVPSFHTFGHVRHFEDADAVKARYAKYFDAFAVAEVPLATGTNRLFVFKGRRNALESTT